MGFYRQKVVDTGRGRHPDLDDNGDLRPDVGAIPDPVELDWRRKFQDQTEWGNFMDRVAARQSRQHPDVQHLVQDRLYDAGDGSPRSGFAKYEEEVEWAQNHVAATNYGKSRYVDDDMISKMSESEYSEYFDERGQPKPDVYHWPSKGQRLDDSSDQWSWLELRQNAARRNQP